MKAVAVTRYRQVLSRANLLPREFAARWPRRTSMVNHVWHTFDNAATRFGDGRVEHPPSVDLVTRAGYSRQVISSGFWFGDISHPQPAMTFGHRPTRRHHR